MHGSTHARSSEGNGKGTSQGTEGEDGIPPQGRTQVLDKGPLDQELAGDCKKGRAPQLDFHDGTGCCADDDYLRLFSYSAGQAGSTPNCSAAGDKNIVQRPTANLPDTTKWMVRQQSR